MARNGPLSRYTKLLVAHAPGMPGTFSPPPRVSDPDMHNGTCVTHVPWCMPGWLTSVFVWSRWREKHSPHSRRMHNPKFYVSGKRSMVDCYRTGWIRLRLCRLTLFCILWMYYRNYICGFRKSYNPCIGLTTISVARILLQYMQSRMIAGVIRKNSSPQNVQLSCFVLLRSTGMESCPLQAMMTNTNGWHMSIRFFIFFGIL